MTESLRHLDKARRCLEQARVMLDVALVEAAGRAAYLAAFHAAQAHILARTGRIARTHRGVRSEFARLAKDDPRIPRVNLTFLAQAYELKSFADYDTEQRVTAMDAAAAIAVAERFVAGIAAILSEG